MDEEVAEQQESCECGGEESYTVSEVDALLDVTHFQQRRLFLRQGFDERLNRQIADKIRYYNIQDAEANVAVEDRDPIYVFCDSEGGDLLTGMYLADVIQNSDTPVVTVAEGLVASACTLVSVSGHIRLAHPSTVFLFHIGQMGAVGRSDNVFDTVAFYKRYINERMKKKYLDNTKITEEKYDELFKGEWYMSADEALEYGVIDEIVDYLV